MTTLGYKHTEKTKRKMSRAKMGYKHTKKARRNMSKAQMGNQKALGYKHTEESKTKMSEAKMGNQYALGNHIVGDNHWNWQGGISFEPYSPEFNCVLRRRIRERDGDTCVVCGNFFSKRNGVHHIDYDRQNCDPLNLITACASCNSMVNGDREYWEEYFTDLMIIIQDNIDGKGAFLYH